MSNIAAWESKIFERTFQKKGKKKGGKNQRKSERKSGIVRFSSNLPFVSSCGRGFSWFNKCLYRVKWWIVYSKNYSLRGSSFSFTNVGRKMSLDPWRQWERYIIVHVHSCKIAAQYVIRISYLGWENVFIRIFIRKSINRMVKGCFSTTCPRSTYFYSYKIRTKCDDDTRSSIKSMGG